MTNPSPELKPCPFPHDIKRGVFLEVDTDDLGFIRGACADCGSAGPYVTLANLAGATEAERTEAASLWNTRASTRTDTPGPVERDD